MVVNVLLHILNDIIIMSWSWERGGRGGGGGIQEGDGGNKERVKLYNNYVATNECTYSCSISIYYNNNIIIIVQCKAVTEEKKKYFRKDKNKNVN